MSRAQLDGRTNTAKAFDRLVSAIHADLGGRDQLSAIEVSLVDAFAGAAVTLDNLNAKILLGEPLDLAAHAQAISPMVRVASRLTPRRRAKDISPTTTLQQYIYGGDDEVAP